MSDMVLVRLVLKRRFELHPNHARTTRISQTVTSSSQTITSPSQTVANPNQTVANPCHVYTIQHRITYANLIGNDVYNITVRLTVI